MQQSFDYTHSVRKFSFGHPMVTALLTQMIFWCFSFVVLGTVLFLHATAFQITYQIIDTGSLTPFLLSSVAMGTFYGALLGLTDYYFFRKWSKGKSIGGLIVAKAVLYFIIMVLLFAFIRLVIWEQILIPVFYKESAVIAESTWTLYFVLICTYTLLMSVFISFFIQINKKFGPGVLLPLIMGKYVQPRIEERAFLFLDLKSSTTYAEDLGHVRYSQLIRDCFLDINEISVLYEAEIYQYVGDEIVLCWLINKGTDLTRCIDFFFACQEKFCQRKEYYKNKHGVVPEFKAGLHKGIVTGVEVGDVKRELAYHGDTLNVTARIQAKCNENNADIIISDAFLQAIQPATKYRYKKIGTIDLKGRSKQVTIHQVIQYQ